MAENLQTEILRQLAEIQRHLGETTSTVQALREETLSQGQDSASHRQRMQQALDNAALRLGKVEDDISALKLVVEKTVQPLVRDTNNKKQQVLGFIAAFSLMGTVAGGIVWLLSVGLPAVVQWFGKASP